MPLSSRYLSVLAIPLIAVLAVSCAQSSSGSLTSPGGVPAASPTAGPSAGYDATGMWRFVSTFNGDPTAPAYASRHMTYYERANTSVNYGWGAGSFGAWILRVGAARDLEIVADRTVR